jgi:hypothetical protein
MTREQWAAMSRDDKQTRIAELAGWSHDTLYNGRDEDFELWWNDEVNKTLPPNDDGMRDRPDFLGDHSALHDALLRMDSDQLFTYTRSLYHIVHDHELFDYKISLSDALSNHFEEMLAATVDQWAEAYVLAMEEADNG